jgi:16S rRNA (cytosine1402-N4)-methyltransferase
VSCLPICIPSLSESVAERLVHRPVLREEVVGALGVDSSGFYVDATCGRGGHSAAILELLGPEGRVLALDRDPEAVQAVRMRFGSDPRFSIVQAPFSRLGDEVRAHGRLGRVQGIVLDLGVSSPQLEDAARGFSFLRDGPLDMRMDPTTGTSAAQWLARAREQDIERVLRQFGEERYARRVAKALVAARGRTPIVTTGQLASLVSAAMPQREPGQHPATRTFQAIRIFVNRELEELERCLKQVPDVLAPRGRLAVVSFHSLEDRMVKRFVREQARGDAFPRDLAVRYVELSPRMRPVGRPIRPSLEETVRNPRARSAVLRVAERLP